MRIFPKRESQRIFTVRFSGHQDFLIGDVRRRPVRGKGQPEMVNDFFDHGIVCEESTPKTQILT